MTKRFTDLEAILQATPLDKDQLEQFRIVFQEKFELLRKLSDDIGQCYFLSLLPRGS